MIVLMFVYVLFMFMFVVKLYFCLARHEKKALKSVSAKNGAKLNNYSQSPPDTLNNIKYQIYIIFYQAIKLIHDFSLITK
jgi:hypothetical protein